VADSLLLRASYRACGAVAWLGLRVVGLRRSVVRDNLRRSFPDWAPARLRAVEREFARRQGEVAAEVLWSGRMAADELRERMRIVNPEVLAIGGQPRPMLLLGAHQCNFEWMVQRLSLELGERLVALYKPPRSPRADRWLRRLRSRFGARLVAAKSVLQELARMRDVAAIGLLADQVPRSSPEKHWVEFLGQDTAFYMGGELLGRGLRAQVCAVKVRRLQRGRYELTLEPLNEPGQKLPPGEVTTRYARALETWIREDPAGWWWTHRRWKLKRRQGTGDRGQ
jgi:Kdo2-lipid IVA lauroyltransferase/acyltransferase